tara:strand:+ start:8345 stop:8608 length:264 start_codon:yes stop_codon:yes gene_type:complete
MTEKKDCCGDSSCIIQPETRGMVTNGGCRCRPHQLKREIILLRNENKHSMKCREELEERIDKFIKLIGDLDEKKVIDAVTLERLYNT